MKAKLLVPACALAALLCSGCQHNYQFNVSPANSTTSVSPSAPATGLKVAGKPGTDGNPASCCADPDSPVQKKS